MTSRDWSTPKDQRQRLHDRRTLSSISGDRQIGDDDDDDDDDDRKYYRTYNKERPVYASGDTASD